MKWKFSLLPYDILDMKIGSVEQKLQPIQK